MKKVVYNGQKEAWYGCTKPDQLIVGQAYEVTSEEVLDWQTNYTLKGVEGKFNSAWFNEPDEKKVFIAVSRTIPVIGKSYNCYKIEFREGEPRLIHCRTTNVKTIVCLGSDQLKVETQNSTYYVKVDC